jgi:hypothetical protein
VVYRAQHSIDNGLSDNGPPRSHARCRAAPRMLLALCAIAGCQRNALGDAAAAVLRRVSQLPLSAHHLPPPSPA